MLSLLFALLLGNSVYRECQVKNHSLTCSKLYNGDAILRSEGLYKMCHISSGVLQSCDDNPYTGEGLIYDQRLTKCKFRKGEYIICTAAEGSAAVLFAE